MREAFDSWKESVIRHGIIKLGEDECVLDYVGRICFHVPFPKMVEDATAFLLRHEWRNLSRWKKIEEEIGKEPPYKEKGSLEAMLKDESFMKVDKEFRKKFRETEMFRKFYEEKVEKSTRIGSQVGNAYTASLLLALDSLFETERELGNDLTGMRIGLGFYGSGATSLALSGIIQEGYKEVAKRFNVFEKLKERRRISVEEYEELHEVRKEKRSISRFFYDTFGRKRKRREINESIIPPSNEFALVRIENNGYRVYKFVE
jgi:hydroxymethylglutaryl-CoA synthase